MAPRVLQANGCSSKLINTNASILAGCNISVPITRLYSLRALVSLNKEHPDSNTEVFVDDTSMHADGDCDQDVIDILIPAMRAFKGRVKC